jgi:HlyD family secretion protein
MSMDKVLEKKKWTKKKVLKISIPAVIIFLVFYLAIFGVSKSTLNINQEILTISTVVKEPFQEYIPITGEVRPLLSIYLDAVEGGQVAKIFKEAGSLVKKGEPILKLENTNLLLDIMYREAQAFEQSNNLRNSRLLLEQNRFALDRDIADADFQLTKLKKNYERQKRLFEEGLISRQSFEDAEDEYEYAVVKMGLTKESSTKEITFREEQIKQLEVSLQRMQANLDVVKRKMESLIVKAPISGQLTSLNAEIGQSISVGTRFGQIDVLDGFKIRAQVDENYIDRVEIEKIGEFDFSEKVYKVKINKIYPEVKNGTFEVDMNFNGKEPEGIRRGQTVYVRLRLSDLSEAIVLSRGAFYQMTGGNWVYILDRSGKYATKRNIIIGRQNPQNYEILKGLNPGDRVITSSYDTFGDKERLILD